MTGKLGGGRGCGKDSSRAVEAGVDVPCAGDLEAVEAGQAGKGGDDLLGDDFGGFAELAG